MGWAHSEFWSISCSRLHADTLPKRKKNKNRVFNAFTHSDSDSRKQLKHRLHSRVIPRFQLSFLFSFFLRQNVSRHSNHASWKTGSSDLRKESLTSDCLKVKQRLKSCYVVELPVAFRTQGHPTTVSSHIHWKHSIQSIFRPLGMHSKRRYKICIRSVVLGELEHESFRNYKGFSIIFLKILDAALRITKNTFFLIPLPSHFCIWKFWVSFFLRKVA